MVATTNMFNRINTTLRVNAATARATVAAA
jgi:hypothetical protein